MKGFSPHFESGANTDQSGRRFTHLFDFRIRIIGGVSPVMNELSKWIDVDLNESRLMYQ